MTFPSELDANLNLNVNLVAKINIASPIFIAKSQVDTDTTDIIGTGSGIEGRYVGVIDSIRVNPTQVDLRRAKQTVDSATIKVIDRDFRNADGTIEQRVFSNIVGTPLSALIGVDVDLYVGLKTAAGFDFQDYILEKSLFIKSITRESNFYKLECKSKIDRLAVPIYNTKGVLDSAINDTVTTIDVLTGTDILKTAGQGQIENEIVDWTGKSFAAGVTTLTGVTRADESSTADSHTAGTEFIQAEKVTANPIDLLLQIILSTGNGTNGSFDVLDDGVGIPESDVATSDFTTIRDSFFSGDSFTLFLVDIESTLRFIEVELLQANNLRFTSNNGKISISVLDQSVPGASLPIVDDNVIFSTPGPRWKISENGLINQFEMQYNYSAGQQKYTRTKTFDDTDSQAIYGVRKGPQLRFRGIILDSIANDRGARFLARFATPQAKISTTNFLKTYDVKEGDKVDFTHSDLPAPGGGLGLNAELEVLKKAIDYARGSVKKEYVFTSYFNRRRGLIAPYTTVASVISTTVFTVQSGKGACYRVGWKLRLWNTSTQDFYSDAANEIVAISGDQITMKDAFSSLAIGVGVKFPDYDESSALQRARYAYIVGASGLFSDGSGGYQIS